MEELLKITFSAQNPARATEACSKGSFCMYRGTDYVQQKKQYNQTIKRLFFQM